MVLALMSNDFRAAFLLLAVLAFLFAALLAYVGHRLALVLVALGLALAWFPAMWDAFAA